MIDNQSQGKELLEKKIEAQAKSIEDRFRELATLTTIIEEQEKRIYELESENESLKLSLIDMQQGAGEPTSSLDSKKIGNTEQADEELIARIKSYELEDYRVLLQSSNIFDATWYLETYPDVAESGMHPIDHYLMHGADEGRNPSPDFNTTNYQEKHLELATHQLNPLVHYIFSTMKGD